MHGVGDGEIFGGVTENGSEEEEGEGSEESVFEVLWGGGGGGEGGLVSVKFVNFHFNSTHRVMVCLMPCRIMESLIMALFLERPVERVVHYFIFLGPL